MNKEEKKAIKSMKRFVECRQDMTAVTASEMKIVLDLLEKKDRIIDEMAEWIDKHTKYYDEDGCYCEVEKEICEKDIECKKCIKQYFERKVENGN